MYGDIFLMIFNIVALCYIAPNFPPPNQLENYKKNFFKLFLLWCTITEITKLPYNYIAFFFFCFTFTDRNAEHQHLHKCLFKIYITCRAKNRPTKNVKVPHFERFHLIIWFHRLFLNERFIYKEAHQHGFV